MEKKLRFKVGDDVICEHNVYDSHRVLGLKGRIIEIKGSGSEWDYAALWESENDPNKKIRWAVLDEALEFLDKPVPLDEIKVGFDSLSED